MNRAIYQTAYDEEMARLDERRCKVGYACGNSCIPTANDCRKNPKAATGKERLRRVQELASGSGTEGRGLGRLRQSEAAAKLEELQGRRSEQAKNLTNQRQQPKQPARQPVTKAQQETQPNEQQLKELQELGQGVKVPGGRAAAGRDLEASLRSQLGDLALSDRDLHRNLGNAMQGIAGHLNNLAELEGTSLEPWSQSSGKQLAGEAPKPTRRPGRNAREAGQEAEKALREGLAGLAGADRDLFRAGQQFLEAGQRFVGNYSELNQQERQVVLGEEGDRGKKPALTAPKSGASRSQAGRGKSSSLAVDRRSPTERDMDELGRKLRETGNALAGDLDRWLARQEQLPPERRASPERIARTKRLREIAANSGDSWDQLRHAHKQAWEAYRRLEEESRRYEESQGDYVSDIESHLGREGAKAAYLKNLGLNSSKEPSASELKRAYRRVVKEVHPDTGGNAEAFRIVNESYEALKKMFRYDSDRTDADSTYLLAYTEERARLDARKCVKGTACGNTCIPEGRQCRQKSANPQQKARTERIANLSKGEKDPESSEKKPEKGGALAVRGGALARREQQPEREEPQTGKKGKANSLEDEYRGRKLDDKTVDEYASKKVKEIADVSRLMKDDLVLGMVRAGAPINPEVMRMSDKEAAQAYEKFIAPQKEKLQADAGRRVGIRGRLRGEQKARDSARRQLADLESMSTAEKAEKARSLVEKSVRGQAELYANNLMAAAKNRGPAVALGLHAKLQELDRRELASSGKRVEVEMEYFRSISNSAARNAVRKSLAGSPENVLGLKEGQEITASSLKNAYRKAAAKAHPDAGGSAEEFQQVTQAYERLKKRHKLDSLEAPFRIDSSFMINLARQRNDAEDSDRELSQLVKEAISEFISPVAVLSINKENGTVSGQFRSGMQTFNYRINASGVAYKPVSAGAAPGRKDSDSSRRDSIYLLAYAEERARLDARKCNKGTECGNSCIPKGRECRKTSNTPQQKAKTQRISQIAGSGSGSGNSWEKTKSEEAAVNKAHDEDPRLQQILGKVAKAEAGIRAAKKELRGIKGKGADLGAKRLELRNRINDMQSSAFKLRESAGKRQALIERQVMKKLNPNWRPLND